LPEQQTCISKVLKMPRTKKSENGYKDQEDFADYPGDDDFFDYHRDHAGQVAGRKRRDDVRRHSQHRARNRYPASEEKGA
jgi:hypothetical protein